MATNFPASLDALTNPTSSDSLSSPSHSAQHANVNDAVEALQVKVGADSSAVTSSLDYKVAQLEAGVTGGKILQVVSTTYETAFTTTVDADVTGLSVTITPTSASNSILVLSSTSYASTGTTRGRLKLFRTIGGTSTNLIGVNGNPGNGFAFAQDTAYNDTNWHQVASFSHLDSPATTSAVTYNIRADSEGGATVYINQSPASTARGGVSTLTVMEVAS